MKKGIILARVSTKEQEQTGLSIEKVQMPQMVDYSEEIEIEVVRTFEFQETASQKLRKNFDEMVQFLKDNDDIKVVIGFRVDRLTRNYRDAVEMDLLRTEYGKELHFVSDRLVLTSKSFGRDIQDWDMKVFLAKQHINRCQEDTHNTQMSKLKAGELYGKAQFGYRNAKDAQGRSTVVVEPFEAGIVKFIFNEYITGATSYQKIREDVEKRFGLKLSKSKVEKIIRHPFYMGLMPFKGKLYPHIYETLITEEIYEKAKAIREGRTQTTKKGNMIGKNGLYRGLINCADCGCMYTPSPNRHKKLNREVQSDCYYYCTNSKKMHNKKPKGTNDAELTATFAELFRFLSIPQKDLEWLQKSLNSVHEGKIQFNEEQIKKQREIIDKSQKRIESAYVDKCDGSITEDEYAKFRQRWRNDQKKAEKILARIREADEEYYITVQYLLQLASRSYEIFMGSEPEEKRRIIQMTLQNLQIKDGELVYEWQKPFDSIFECKGRLLWGERRGSNPRPSGPQPDALPTELRSPCVQ